MVDNTVRFYEVVLNDGQDRVLRVRAFSEKQAKAAAIQQHPYRVLRLLACKEITRQEYKAAQQPTEPQPVE